MLQISNSALVSWKENLHKIIISIGFDELSSQESGYLDNEIRIKFIVQRVSEGPKYLRTIPAPTVKSKCDIVSSYYQCEDVKLSNMHQTNKAIDMFTRALAYALPKGYQIISSYKSRSFAFYKKKMFADICADCKYKPS